LGQTNKQRQTTATDHAEIAPRSSRWDLQGGLRTQSQRPPRRISRSRTHPPAHETTATNRAKEQRGAGSRGVAGEFDRDRARSPSEPEETHPSSSASAGRAAELGDGEGFCCCCGAVETAGSRACASRAEIICWVGRLAAPLARAGRDGSGSANLGRRTGQADGGWAGRLGWHP
jgi:hypothetical protein